MDQRGIEISHETPALYSERMRERPTWVGSGNPAPAGKATLVGLPAADVLRFR